MKSLSRFKKPIFYFLLVVILYYTFLFFRADQPLTLNLYSDELGDFEVTEEKTLKFSELYVLSGSSRYLNIEKTPEIEKSSANVLMENEIIGIEALFANMLSPYPGDISNEIVCNERYKPVFFERKINDIDYKYYLLYSNERFGIGVCTEDAVVYKHLIGWIYCPQTKELYKIGYFTPLNTSSETMENFFLSLYCK